MIQQTIITTFANPLHKKELSPRQRAVLKAIRELGHRATMIEVAIHMKTPLNRISGRFSELVGNGCLAKVCKKGRYTVYEAIAWPKEEN